MKKTALRSKAHTRDIERVNNQVHEHTSEVSRSNSSEINECIAFLLQLSGSI